jgi:hypothetical protein
MLEAIQHDGATLGEILDYRGLLMSEFSEHFCFILAIAKIFK